MATRAKQPAGEKVPYTLKAPPKGGGGWTDPTAVLQSPLLDPAMHPDGSVALHARLAKPATRELAPFELASLLAYLREQPAVRRAIEAKFAKENAPGSDPWSHARVSHLILEPLNVPKPDRIKGRRADLFDKPDTTTKFFVVLGVDWDREHPRTAYFRDGRLFDWSLG